MLTSADRKAVTRRLKALMSRYQELDNALWYLQQDPATIRGRIRAYQAELNGFLKTETIRESVIRDDVNDALSKFEKNLAGYLSTDEVAKRLPRLERLQQAVIDQYATQIDTVTGHIGSTLNSRGAQYRALAQAAEIPLARAAAVEGYTIRAVSIGGKQYNAVQLGEYWGRMLDEYGTRGSIQYRNGTNYPLTTYIDQRIRTSAAETARLTAVVSSTALGITLGKISQTGTADSCKFWEGKYVFMSEEAKAQTIAARPNVKSLRSIPTVQQIKADKTHMFKWNCRHEILPQAITVLDDAEFAEEFEQSAAVQPEIPKKIDERKIYEEITGDKYAPTKGGETAKLEKAAELDVKEVSYTIQ